MDAIAFQRAVEDVIAALERWHLPEPQCKIVELCTIEDATANKLMTLKDVLRLETNCVDQTRHNTAANAVLALERLIEAEKANTPAWRALRVAFDVVMDQRAYRVRWPTTAADHEILAQENDSTAIVYAGFIERAELDSGLLQRLRDAAAAFVASTLPDDGPIEPDGFRFGGNEIIGIPHMEFIIAAAAWKKASVKETMVELWPGHRRPWDTRKELEKRKSQLNKRLATLDIAVSVRNGTLTIVPERKMARKTRLKPRKPRMQ